MHKETLTADTRLSRDAFTAWLRERQGQTLCGGYCPISHFTGLPVGMASYGENGEILLPEWARNFVRKFDRLAVWAHPNEPYSVDVALTVLNEV